MADFVEISLYSLERSIEWKHECPNGVEYGESEANSLLAREIN